MNFQITLTLIEPLIGVDMRMDETTEPSLLRRAAINIVCHI